MPSFNTLMIPNVGFGLQLCLVMLNGNEASSRFYTTPNMFTASFFVPTQIRKLPNT